MDLTQNKLTRDEWNSIEHPVTDAEKEILKLIEEGFENPNVRKNKTLSLFTFTKIEITKDNEFFLFTKYFKPIIEKTMAKYPLKGFVWTCPPEPKTLKKLKSIDAVRIQNLKIESNQEGIFEFFMLDFCHELTRYFVKENTKYASHLYTLIHIFKNNIYGANQYVCDYIREVIRVTNAKTNVLDVIERAYTFIEKNPYLLEYEDKTLYSHQNELFALFRTPNVTPKLVLYTAPTGTGKTLSPLGLSVKYRVIFVCVARHIGMALAKSAISMGKKIAFAFGCDTTGDVRLHNFSAVKFIKDKRSGGIAKVDNEDGRKVEIMICDVKSYLVAMNYMIAFHSIDQIITYWDEPTITMDCETHALHEVIHKNWCENRIPNVVLSCATLPKETEIMETIIDFRDKFEGAEIHNISSHDYRKTIPIVTKEGFCALPHTLYEDYAKMKIAVNYCMENKTMLRYFDLREIVDFILCANHNEWIGERYKIVSYFPDISHVTMNNIKLYYLEVLNKIREEKWQEIYTMMKAKQRPKFEEKKEGTSLKRMSSMQQPPTNPQINGILLTTKDAHTLTDGPSIFLTEDAMKIGNFFIQESKIPNEVFQSILQKITKNGELSSKISILEKRLEDLDKEKELDKDVSLKSPEIRGLYREIETLRKQIMLVALDPEYVPNTVPHQMKWTDRVDTTSFIPFISETVVENIMALDVNHSLKLLLLLGIGLFLQDVSPKYLELMKHLAQNQHLLIIIASSDFIYGTNYNFCHGFIAKDMMNMTQSKTIQCLGRIGRSAIQSTYTVRFRTNDCIYRLLEPETTNIEAMNMVKLFTYKGEP